MIGCVIYYKITESNVRLLNTPTVALYWIELGDIDDTKEEKKRFFFFSYFIQSRVLLSVAYLTVANLARLGILVQC